MVGRYSDGYCGCTQSASRRFILSGNACVQWWETFMDFTFADLRDMPCAETIRKNAEKAIQTACQRHCRYCTHVVPGGMRDFAVCFANNVEKLIAKVELDMKF